MNTNKKETLLKLSDFNTVTLERKADVDGLINLIDNFQDYAVDVIAIPSETVFNLKSENGEERSDQNS